MTTPSMQNPAAARPKGSRNGKPKRKQDILNIVDAMFRKLERGHSFLETIRPFLARPDDYVLELRLKRKPEIRKEPPKS